MADPLSLLREFTRNKKPVVLENDNFVFDGIKYPRSIETAFRSRRGEGPPYTLDALWFLLQQADQKYQQYLSECRKQKFPHVSLIDKKDIISYLNGEIDTSASISGGGMVLSDITQATEDEERLTDDRSSKKQKTLEMDENLLKEKEQFQSKLSAPKFRDTTSDASVGMGDLSADDVSKLRRMRHMKKITSVKDDELPAGQKSKYVEADEVITRDILSNERLLQTRTSVLQTRNKKTFTSLIDVASTTLRSDHKKKVEQMKKVDEQRKSQSYDRYQDIEEERFWKDRLKGNEPDEFQIDTRGTFADSGRLPDVSQLSQKPKPKPTSRPKAVTESPDIKKDPKNLIPIIIVPSGLTSPLTLYNVKALLEDGNFIPSIEKKNSGTKKESVVALERKKGGNAVPYQVIDNAVKLAPQDWNRVVAVFALGQMWQFKGWRWETPVDIFSHVPGFYLKYEDDNLPDTIKSWDVKVLTVSKTTTKKHLAQTAALEFWDTIDNYCLTRKNWLNY